MNYSVFVESLKRLYATGKISDGRLRAFIKSGRITQQEYDYIVSREV